MSALDALPVQPAAWTNLLRRGDIVLERGMLHLVSPDTTPEEARTSDLLAVADVLDSAGIPFLLIRHDRSCPALVIDQERQRDAVTALSRLAEREPLYAKVKGSPVLRSSTPSEPLMRRAASGSSCRVSCVAAGLRTGWLRRFESSSGAPPTVWCMRLTSTA